MIDTITQVIIAVGGVVSIGLAQTRYRFTAACLGVAIQPFWLYATISAQQWGMMFATWGYLAAFGYGVWQFWPRPYAKQVINVAPETKVATSIPAEHFADRFERHQ